MQLMFSALGATDQPQANLIKVPLETEKKIHGLRNDTEYRFEVWAATSAGPGAVSSLNAKTLPLSGNIKSVYILTCR